MGNPSLQNAASDFPVNMVPHQTGRGSEMIASSEKDEILIRSTDKVADHPVDDIMINRELGLGFSRPGSSAR